MPIETTNLKRNTAMERARMLVVQSRQSVARLKHGLFAKRPELSAKAEKPWPSAALRAEASAQIDQAARNGFVPDAHVLRLYDSHVAELAEMRCQLGEAEAGHQAASRQLDAMFPEPPVPLPEPPTPATPKNYPRMGDLFGGTGKASPLN
jgi:hypothetical protein